MDAEKKVSEFGSKGQAQASHTLTPEPQSAGTEVSERTHIEFEERYVDEVVSIRSGGGVNTKVGDNTHIATGLHPDDFKEQDKEQKQKQRQGQAKGKKKTSHTGPKREPILHGPVEFVQKLPPSGTNVKSMRDAQEVADVVLDQLQVEVDDFFTKHDMVQKKPAVGRPSEVGSIRSSLILGAGADADTDTGTGVGERAGPFVLDEPSTMDLFYEKGDPGKLRTKSFTVLGEESRLDAECQAKIHRTRLRRPSGEPGEFGTDTEDKGTQTREMAFVRESGGAELLFRKLYPKPDNYLAPSPPSRTASLEQDVVSARGESADVDRAKVGPKVKWSRKPRLLPPLPQDYHKVESFWTGSTFAGKYEGRQFEHGFFNYPLMSTYESEFKRGVIHTKKHRGLVVYPRGDTFEGDWARGRYMAGRITFEDGLKFSPHDWSYLEPGDRRFYVEQDIGVKQAGRTLYNNNVPPPKILPGLYDACEGVYDPESRTVTSYNGMELRKTKNAEHEFILSNYRQAKVVQERYVAQFNPSRLPCSYGDVHPDNCCSRPTAVFVGH